MKFFKLLALSCLLALASTAAQAGWFTDLFKDTYTDTRYPIVLVHGFSGFDNIAGYDYFYQVPQELRRSGADVFVAQVAAGNTSEIRGEQLARQVEAILATTGADRVNLIAHSQGSPTSRYVASVYPQYVASVTGVGGVDWGTPLADTITGMAADSALVDGFIDTVADGFFSLLDYMSGGGYEQDVMASALDMTTAGAVAFNAKYPEGMPTTYCGEGQKIGSNGVYYFSWGGDSSSTGGITTGIDPADWMLAATSLVFDEPNDGITTSCSGHLGQIIRDDYYMNHFDEVNQVMGLTSLFETNPVTLYRNQANRLKNIGL